MYPDVISASAMVSESHNKVALFLKKYLPLADSSAESGGFLTSFSNSMAKKMMTLSYKNLSTLIFSFQEVFFIIHATVAVATHL